MARQGQTLQVMHGGKNRKTGYIKNQPCNQEAKGNKKLPEETNQTTEKTGQTRHKVSKIFRRDY